MKTLKERAAALAANEQSPIRTLPALEALSEAEIANLEAHVTTKTETARAAGDAKKTRVSALVASPHCTVKTEAALLAMSEEELTALEATVKTATDAAAATTRAAAAPATAEVSEADWLKTAPASVRTLVEAARKQEATRKSTLVASLKANQKVYSETELTAMGVEQLEKVAALANGGEPVDYSGQGFPRAAESESDVYRNPPDGYRAALDKRSGKKPEEATKH